MTASPDSDVSGDGAPEPPAAEPLAGEPETIEPEMIEPDIVEPPNGLVVAISARLTDSWRQYSRHELIGSTLDLAIASGFLLGLAVVVHSVWQAVGETPPGLRPLIGGFALLMAMLMIAGLVFGTTSRDARTYGGTGPFRPVRRLIRWIPERVRALLTQAARVGDALAGEMAVEQSAWLLLIAGDGLNLDAIRSRFAGTEDDLRDALRMLSREGLLDVHQTGPVDITVKLTGKGREFLKGE